MTHCLTAWPLLFFFKRAYLPGRFGLCRLRPQLWILGPVSSSASIFLFGGAGVGPVLKLSYLVSRICSEFSRAFSAWRAERAPVFLR